MAEDLDGDGRDEVVIAFQHRVYWPSYGLLYEPASRMVVALYAATGHHSPIGAMDLNGDGRKEIIIAGVNNHMGWATAVGAIECPAIQHASTTQPGYVVATTPDVEFSNGSRELLWYAVLPSNVSILLRQKVDPVLRQVRVDYGDGRFYVLDANGFLKGSENGSPSVRTAERRAAYTEMRGAMRGASAQEYREALPKIERAVEHAKRANDRFLFDWLEQSQARLRVLANDPGGEAQFEAIAARTPAPSEVYWNAARAFHQRGDLARALAWYERGITVGGSMTSGRQRYEFGEAAVVILCESKKFDEARRVADILERTSPDSVSYAAAFRAYANWRETGQPGAIAPSLETEADLERYWRLEFRLANGEDPKSLMADVEKEKKLASDSTTLLDGITAELLWRLGREDEARDLARKALTDARRESETDVVIRAHLWLFKQRAAAHTR